MPSSFSDETLSAYLDDELPSEERAAVALWLESSPEARRTLAGLRQVRVCFEDLPRAELPREFAAEVLQQAERQMLLPTATATAAVAVPPRDWRRWLLPAMATASAAALALVLAVQTERGGAERAMSQPLAARLEGERQTVADDNRALTPGTAAKSGEGFSIDAAETAGTLAPAMPAAARSSDLDAEADELVEAIRAAGDAGQVPVVRLYVVDGHADLRFVQWVLEKNQAESAAKNSPEGERFRPEEAAGTAAVGGRTEALVTKNTGVAPRQGLLVITSPGQLGDVLQALLQDKGRVIGVRVDAPIDVARLDEPARRAVEEEESLAAAGKAAEQVAGLSKSRFPASAAAGRDAKSFAPSSAAARSRVGSTQGIGQQRGRTVAASADRAVPPTHEAEVPGRLKQLVVSVPESATSGPESATSGPESATSGPESATSGLNRVREQPPAHYAKEKTAAATPGALAKGAEPVREAAEAPAPSLVRVIILVEPQSAAEKRPQPPAKPSEGGNRQRAGRSRFG